MSKPPKPANDPTGMSLTLAEMRAGFEALKAGSNEVSRVTPIDLGRGNTAKQGPHHLQTAHQKPEPLPGGSSPHIITLNVGGQKFQTVLSTLTSKSAYFRGMFSTKSHSPSPDGSYFIDADPELFKHLLQYMRRPEAYPIFWSETGSFDYTLYGRLETEAKFFGLDTLYNWIARKMYESKIKVSSGGPATSNAKVTQKDLTIVKEKESTKHVCPRFIKDHNGRPDRCGKLCRKALINP